MVLGFAKGGERFHDAKDVTPGPGAYDPNRVEGFKADPKSGFLTGERFGESQELEGMKTSCNSASS
jgi:hypothetical protein